MEERVAVAMSGGVDSTAAALLLKEAGASPFGVTLRLQDGPGDETERARRAAERLGMDHYVVDARAEFCRWVMEPFAGSYRRGETPNPCVGCNRTIKFGVLLERAMELGADALATGHYARTRLAPDGRVLLCKAARPEKDQSYVLAMLTQDQLSRARFPLGEYAKEEIRSIAASAGLENAKQPDSQDICFIPDGDYVSFLKKFTGTVPRPGPFVDQEGRVLGEHRGIECYTVGQRRGLGISASRPLYVKELRPEENAVVLSWEEELYSTGLEADGLNLTARDDLYRPQRLGARVRYRQREQPALVEQTGPDTVRVTFDAPQRAITPGQTVVFYDGDVVVGGATIRRALP